MGLIVTRNRKSTDDKGASNDFPVLAYGTPQEVLWKENFRSSTRGIGRAPGQRTFIIAATRDQRTSCIGQLYHCHRRRVRTDIIGRQDGPLLAECLGTPVCPGG